MIGMAIGAMSFWVAIVAQNVDAARIYELSCFSDQSIVAMTNRGRLLIRSGSNWQPAPLAADAMRLWRSPDDRLFVVDWNSIAMDISHGARSATRWQLPRESATPRFAFLDGVVAVTPERIFRLDPGSKATDIGETPGGPGGLRPNRPPVLIGDNGRLIACYGTSVREDDDVQGECRAPALHSYQYLVDFGDPSGAIGESSHFVAPFACGEAVVSVRRGLTQARDLTTGVLLGRVAGAARTGSGCLDGQRAVLIGKSDIRVVDVPHLRRVWRNALAGSIVTAAVCGAKVAAILEKQSDPVMVDLPPAVATKLPRTGQTVVPTR
jgi:hypothetical protein